MQNIFIRFGTFKDAELIAAISRLTFYDSFASQNTKENIDKFLNEQFSTNKLIAEVGAPGNIFLLAFIADEPVGYVRLRENGNLEDISEPAGIEIVRIYSVQKTIGKGVGSALMKKCLEIAKEKNKSFVWLGVWEKNLRAIDFYLKWGFKKFAEHDFILGNDVQRDWLMKREVQ